MKNKKKTIVLVVVLVLVVGFGSYYLGFSKVASSSIPGCSSSVGYSTTTGQKCDGTTLPQAE